MFYKLQLNGGIVSLTMEEIKRAYPDTNSLVGSSVYVKASVMTSTGGKIPAFASLLTVFFSENTLTS